MAENRQLRSTFELGANWEPLAQGKLYNTVRLLPVWVMTASYILLIELGLSLTPIHNSPLLQFIGAVFSFILILLGGILAWVFGVLTGQFELSNSVFKLMPWADLSFRSTIGIVFITSFLVRMFLNVIRKCYIAYKIKSILTILCFAVIIFSITWLQTFNLTFSQYYLFILFGGLFFLMSWSFEIKKEEDNSALDKLNKLKFNRRSKPKNWFVELIQKI